MPVFFVLLVYHQLFYCIFVIRKNTMKNILFLVAVFATLSSAKGQSCCMKNTDQTFAQLAMNESFAAAHLDPLPYDKGEHKGEVITFSTSDDNLPGNAYLIKAKNPTNNWILIYHEWWGLNDYIKSEADKIQASVGNCNVMAIDLYDGKVATDAKLAQEYSSSLNDGRVRNIIQGAYNYLSGESKVISLGWCLGGGWSLQSALMGQEHSVGCVIYYGMPESDVEKLSKLSCDILGFYGSKDKFINSKLVDEFKSNLKTAGIKNTIKIYDADHAFANPSNPKHDVVASKDAYTIAIKYIKGKFGTK